MHLVCDSKTRKMETNTGLIWSKKAGEENQILFDQLLISSIHCSVCLADFPA